MGRIVKHKDDSWAVLYVRVPGWFKNQIAAAAKKEKVSVNTWVANHLLKIIEDKKGLPPAPPAVTAPPSPWQILEGAIVDRPPLEPCGVPFPCKRESEGEEEFAGFVYCNACRIRVR